MATQDLIDYYANLLILQYVGMPKAYATIQTLVSGPIMGQPSDPTTTLPVAVQNAYNINPAFGPTAVGVQLDVIGKYAGVSRNGIGVTGNSITLTDGDFLALIQMAIIRNNSGSSLQTIQEQLNQFFPGNILVFDYSNMHMSYLISTAIGSINLIQLFITEGLLPKPMGVQLGSIIYTAIIDAFFGMTEYSLYEITHQVEQNASPFNSYGWQFNCNAANATAGATYTNNSITFTVLGTIASGTQLLCSGSGAPAASGILTKASGTGDATITYSSFFPNYQLDWPWLDYTDGIGPTFISALLTESDEILTTEGGDPLIIE